MVPVRALVAVVIQERQDAERPVVQRDNGISEAKVLVIEAFQHFGMI